MKALAFLFLTLAALTVNGETAKPPTVDAGAAARAAQETADDVLAVSNDAKRVALPTLEHCLLGVSGFNRSGGRRLVTSIAISGTRYDFDGRRIWDPKKSGTTDLWSYTDSFDRSKSSDRHRVEALKRVIVREFEQVRHANVTAATSLEEARAAFEALAACENVPLETYGMTPISKVARAKMSEIQKLFPELRPARGQSSRTGSSH